jgi:ketosteroid isomerase-like protein
MTAEELVVDPFGTNLRRIQMVVELLCLGRDEAVHAISPLLHPELQVLAAPGVAPARGYQSREEFLAYFADARAHGMKVEPDVAEICVAPSGAVLVTGRMQVEVQGEVDVIPAWFVYTFRDGLIARLENHLDHDMAKAAVGLTDPPRDAEM